MNILRFLGRRESKLVRKNCQSCFSMVSQKSFLNKNVLNALLNRKKSWKQFISISGRLKRCRFLDQKTAALRLFAGDEKKQRRCRYHNRKSSGASSVAGKQRRCAIQYSLIIGHNNLAGYLWKSDHSIRVHIKTTQSIYSFTLFRGSDWEMWKECAPIPTLVAFHPNRS